MRNRLYLLSLVLVLTATLNESFCQNYQSLFGDSSTTWDIAYGVCDYLCSQTTEVTGDTNIHARDYKLISGIPGFVRENTIEGKAWFYNAYTNSEYVVMDLSLSLGDTFNFYDYNNVPYPCVVDSIYSVSNKKHVRINGWTSMCGFEEKITFIEGSGTTAGLGYLPTGGSAVNYYMLCHHKDGVKVAGNLLFMDTCYVCYVGIAEHDSDQSSVNAFPNPASTTIHLQLPSTPTTITIFNLLGEKVKEEKVSLPAGQAGGGPASPAGREITIDVSELPAGLYFVRTGETTAGKFVKE